MLFDSPGDIRWKPFYIQVVRLYWMGQTKTDIAAQLGLSEGTVKKVIESDRGREIFNQLESATFDSMLETTVMAQAVAPEMLREKIKLALYSGDEKIRTKNASDVLGIAGHVPIQKVIHDRPDPLLDKYKDKSELDLRKELREIVGDTGRGPDGNLVN